MRRIFGIGLLFAVMVVITAGCQNKKNTEGNAAGDTLKLKYAENISIVKYPNYTAVTLRNPWDTLKVLHRYVLVDKHRDAAALDNVPEGTIVEVPLNKSLVYSSVHCSLLQMLGQIEAVAGVCDLKYIKLPAVQQGVQEGRVADCGDAMNPDIERIIELHLDAVLLSPFENSGGYGRIEQLNIPIIECADYMETSALGRAEWIRFYGLLFGEEQKADSLFAVVEKSYNEMKEMAARATSAPSVLSELKTGAAWYVPGGKSTMGRLYADANARYIFAEDEHSGSIPLSFEEVFERGGEADVWLFKYNAPEDMSYADLKSENPHYAAFKPFRTKNIYACNTGKVPFYEETPFRPDLLLSDFIQIFHSGLLKGGLHYFKKLDE